MKHNRPKILFTLAFMIVFANFSHAQKAAPANKAQLVAQLVEYTFEAFPITTVQNEIEQMKTDGGDKLKEEIPKLLVSKVEENEDFSAEKKDAVKAKIPAFGERFGNRVTEIFGEGLDLNLWIKESLAENFTKNFTVPELRKINAFMKSKNGTAFFEAIKEEVAAESEKRASTVEQKLEGARAVEIEKFLNSPLGVKFMDFFGKDTEAFLTKKIELWGDQMLKNLDEDMENGELGKMLQQFIEENFQ